MIATNNIITLDVNATQISAPLHTLATHTRNTYEPDRTPADIADDTTIGKVAEFAVEQYALQLGVPLLTWDAVRRDNYRRSAPVDGFVAAPEVAHLLQSEEFRAGVWDAHNAGWFWKVARNWEAAGIYSYEVKSTRVQPRHRLGRQAEGRVDHHRLLTDDFFRLLPGLTKPATQRLWHDMKSNLLLPARVQAEQTKAPFYLIRAYVEECGREKGDQQYHVHIIGRVTRDDFYLSENLRVKVMGNAVYYTMSLESGEPLPSEIISTASTQH